ncbi:MAG: DUF3726 domain-containing protein [Pseudomonadota bacterium]
MHPSFNEIAVTVRKAAVGCGWPHGLAEDIAAAAVWLVAQGQDGVGAALMASAAGPQASSASNAGSDLIFNGPCGAAQGVSALDMLEINPELRVEMHSPVAPLLVCGLAGCAARDRGVSFLIAGDNDWTVLVTADGLAPRDAGWRTAIDQTARLILRTDARAGGSATRRVPVTVTPSAQPIVDDTVWQHALALAARTHVAPSEASRLRGAGAGLTDND